MEVTCQSELLKIDSQQNENGWKNISNGFENGENFCKSQGSI